MKLFNCKINVNYWFIFPVALIAINIAKADPASKVARLSYIENIVSFLPGGEKKWVKASVNRPLIPGDSLWVDKNSRAELQLGSATVRLNGLTNTKILNLNNKINQFQLTQGTLLLTVYRSKPEQKYEIDTPNLALTLSRKGLYRVDVDKNSTVVSIRKGEANVYAKNSALKLREGLSCRFTGTNLKDYQCKAIGPMDEFDRWSLKRDQRIEKASSTKHVSSAVIGYEDLEFYGKWKSVKKHGYVWIPDDVEEDWVPYRTGHWVWIQQWGWTWVDEQPWGFAPFHYGRWTYIEKRWAWVPGPVDVEPLYAPALVAFVGGRNFQLEVTTGTVGIAWFPLGPGDIYIPPYDVSRHYFTQINISNTVINNTYINKIYNDRSVNINYQNVNISNAITAVPTQTFIQSQPVSSATVQVSEETIEKAPISSFASVTPESASLLGGAETDVQPAQDITDRSAIVKTEPAAQPVPFSKEKQLLEKNPGEPLSAEETQNLQEESVKPTQLQLVDPKTSPQPVEETTQPVQEPEVKQPEVQPSQPEVQQAPEAQEQPEVQQPEVQPSQPDIQQAPEVQEQPEVQQPEVQPSQPDIQQAPEVQEQPEVQQPEVQPSQPDVQQAPEVQEQPEVQQPEVQPDVQQTPEVQDQ
ncbi:hypothetical protein FOG18_09305 [Legionella israelensis]|uniref:DUF6600 domain-containing protein n=1 Tax=Legionella israelensis TaxID=454 RepID=UPI00117C16BD|nr:DUF6600 domain-containing protein [Legionella israelensis]QDP72739.1 hypothetical protein FOG18_09305 [Legionella israelensis]